MLLGGNSFVILCCCALALAQENTSQGIEPPTFQSKVNVVLVPVVVRDKHGHPIRSLKKDDFQVFDNGKPQAISSFSAIEHPREFAEGDGKATSPQVATGATIPARAEPQNLDHNTANPASRRNFIYIFDDLHTRFSDLAHMRAAAIGHFEKGLTAGDRAAIFTVSGKHSLDFTSDRGDLEAAASKVAWAPVAGRGGMECPDVSYYIADLVINKADSQALDALTFHTAECAHVRPELARAIALQASSRELIIGSHDTRLALSTLRRAVRRLSGMPGERIIVLASPGFFAQTAEALRATAEVLELAAKNNVIINGLGARGVIVAEEEEDVARKVVISRRQPPTASSPDQSWVRYRRETARADGDVMKDLAEGTGGVFFHNNNDLRAGFERVAVVPEFSYVLGFSPSELKADARYHALKVRVPNEMGARVEARHGYYVLPPDTKTRDIIEEIEDAAFSRDEQHDIPIVFQAGYSKPRGADVVTVLLTAKIDVSSLPDQRSHGRYYRSLDVSASLFDADGGYVTGTAEAVDANEGEGPAPKNPAVTLHWEFPGVVHGDYTVRLVIVNPRSKARTMMSRTLKIF